MRFWPRTCRAALLYRTLAAAFRGDWPRARVALLLRGDVFDGMNPVNATRLVARRLGRPPNALGQLIHQEVMAAQLLMKLTQKRAAGVELYEISTAEDGKVCTACSELAASGPYRVRSAVLPGRPHCEQCRCSIVSLR